MKHEITENTYINADYDELIFYKMYCFTGIQKYWKNVISLELLLCSISQLFSPIAISIQWKCYVNIIEQ
jgi:hypothetical protein